MNFRTDATVPEPALAHARGCHCPLHARRLFSAALLGTAALPALGQPIEE